MDSKRTRFIEVWQASPSLEVAASILGMKVRSVTRQANRLKAMGVPLKTLTDPRFNPHSNRREKRPLTNEEQAFVAEHYQFARRMAWKTCHATDLPQQLVEDIAEGAAVEALLLTARRSTEPGFISETVKGLIFTAVRCQVIALMRKLLGPVRASPIIAEIAPAQSLTPLQEVIAREEHAQQVHEHETARQLIGSMPDTSKRRMSGTKKEYLSLRMKARELGLCTEGTTDELRERLAAYYRGQLVQYEAVDERPKEQEGERERAEFGAPPPVEQIEQESMAAPSNKAPSRISQYLTPAPTPPSPKSPEQLDAERFAEAWTSSRTAAEAAQTLGRKLRSVLGFAGYLRSMGVPLKKMPTHCGPLVRAVRQLVPSCN